MADNYDDVFQKAIDETVRNMGNEPEFKAYIRDEGIEVEEKALPTTEKKFINNLPPNHFISRYIKMASKVTDSYPEYHLGCALMLLSIATQRKLFVKVIPSGMYTNLWILLLGYSTISRKSTAIKLMIAIMDMAGMGHRRLPQEFSPEALIEELSHNPKNAFIRDEYGEFHAKLQKSYNLGMDALFCVLYDNPNEYVKKLRKETFELYHVFFPMISATVPRTLSKYCTEDDLVSGYFARFNFLFPKRRKSKLKLKEIDADVEEEQMELAKWLKEIHLFFSERNDPVNVKFQAGVLDYFDEWTSSYEDFIQNSENQEQVGAFYARASDNCLKISALLGIGTSAYRECLRGTDFISISDFIPCVNPVLPDGLKVKIGENGNFTTQKEIKDRNIKRVKYVLNELHASGIRFPIQIVVDKDDESVDSCDYEQTKHNTMDGDNEDSDNKGEKYYLNIDDFAQIVRRTSFQKWWNDVILLRCSAVLPLLFKCDSEKAVSSKLHNFFDACSRLENKECEKAYASEATWSGDVYSIYNIYTHNIIYTPPNLHLHPSSTFPSVCGRSEAVCVNINNYPPNFHQNIEKKPSITLSEDRFACLIGDFNNIDKEVTNNPNRYASASLYLFTPPYTPKSDTATSNALKNNDLQISNQQQDIISTPNMSEKLKKPHTIDTIDIFSLFSKNTNQQQEIPMNINNSEKSSKKSIYGMYADQHPQFSKRHQTILSNGYVVEYNKPVSPLILLNGVRHKHLKIDKINPCDLMISNYIMGNAIHLVNSVFIPHSQTVSKYIQQNSSGYALEKVFELILNATEPISVSKLLRKSHLKTKECTEIVQTLLISRRIREFEYKPKRGRSSRVFEALNPDNVMQPPDIVVPDEVYIEPEKLSKTAVKHRKQEATKKGQQYVPPQPQLPEPTYEMFKKRIGDAIANCKLVSNIKGYARMDDVVELLCNHFKVSSGEVDEWITRAKREGVVYVPRAGIIEKI